MMKVALTGATGFLGRYIRQRLTEGGHEVVAWYRGDSAPKNDLVGWIPGCLGDTDAAYTLTQGVDWVVHAGVERQGGGFLAQKDDPIEYFDVNVIGSLKLMEAAVNNGVERFVFVSSGAVHERVAENRELDETHPLWPASLYGAYKASVETLVHAYGLSGKLNCCTLRPTSIYGVAEQIEDSKWFDIVRDITAGNDVVANGGGKLVHADDVARAILLLLSTRDSTAGECFNCSDRFISRFEVAEITKRVSRSQSKLSGEPKTSKRSMDTSKIQGIGMTFGGTSRLESTISEMIRTIRGVA